MRSPARAFWTHKTEGNFNNEIGMPLSILSMPETAQVCVLEMGMSQAGEISRMTRIATPEHRGHNQHRQLAY